MVGVRQRKQAVIFSSLIFNSGIKAGSSVFIEIFFLYNLFQLDHVLQYFLNDNHKWQWFCFIKTYRRQNDGAAVRFGSLMEHIWMWLHGCSLIPAYLKEIFTYTLCSSYVHLRYFLFLLSCLVNYLQVEFVCYVCPDKMYTVGSCRISRVRLSLSHSSRVCSPLAMNTNRRIQLCEPNYQCY